MYRLDDAKHSFLDHALVFIDIIPVVRKIILAVPHFRRLFEEPDLDTIKDCYTIYCDNSTATWISKRQERHRAHGARTCRHTPAVDCTRSGGNSKQMD